MEEEKRKRVNYWKTKETAGAKDRQADHQKDEENKRRRERQLPVLISSVAAARCLFL